jgi:hypothetical protein
MIKELLTEGAQAGELRDDIAPDELASYCLHALTAAGGLRSKAAVRRLVTVTLTGMRPAATRSDSSALEKHSRHSSGTVDSSPVEPRHGPWHHTARGHQSTDS